MNQPTTSATKKAPPPPLSAGRVALLHWIAIGSLFALIGLALVWELFMSAGPGRPGLLALKVLLLLLPLPGILRGRRYTCQWAPMLVLAYFVEGVMRGYADEGPGAAAGWIQALLSVLFIMSAAYYARDAHRRA